MSIDPFMPLLMLIVTAVSVTFLIGVFALFMADRTNQLKKRHYVAFMLAADNARHERIVQAVLAHFPSDYPDW